MGELLEHRSQTIIMEPSLVIPLLALSSGRLTVQDSMVRAAASHMRKLQVNSVTASRKWRLSVRMQLFVHNNR